MSAPNPYADDLGPLDPLDALAKTPREIRALVESWDASRFERSYAPGKWDARRILVHLAQTELALGTRARFALTQHPYTAQAFSQDDWMPLDDLADARTALDVYTTLRWFNLTMWRSLNPAQMSRPFHHPEYGELTVSWILAQMAGHDIHHLKQLQNVT